MSTKDQDTYRDILGVYERRSTCARIRVACTITKNGRSIVSGWNGVLAGSKHCCDHFPNYDPVTMDAAHRQFSIENELHAEANAIGFAARHGIAVEGADLYVTYSPCLDCAKLISAAGIKQVFYKHRYDRTPEGILYLERHNIPVTKLDEPQQNQEKY
jgi:dCMP deaminase